ncbi:MAG: di-heme oxidoredictase family protein, partial [Pirellulaceae bacterium]
MNHRLYCFVVTTVAISLLWIEAGSTAEPDAVAQGKQLFQREWKFQPVAEKIEEDVFFETTSAKRFDRDDVLKNIAGVRGDGLGPLHNATSCEACHVGGGAAGVDRNVTMLTIDPRSPVIESIGNSRAAGFNQADQGAVHLAELKSLYPGLVGELGRVSVDVVVHEKSAADPAKFESIRQAVFAAVPGGVDPAWGDSSRRTSESIATEPVVAGRKGNVDFYLSQRNPPPLFGLQQIDRISTSRLNKIARLQAVQSGGKITGRLSAGKFGWRAQSPNLASFVRGACAGELGLQVSDIAQVVDPTSDDYVSVGNDLTDDQVTQLVSYVGSLPAPVTHGQSIQSVKEVRDGQRAFESVGCAACHVENVSPARGIYSDLLLHDMGIDLQAPSPAPPEPIAPSIQLSSMFNLSSMMRRGSPDGEFDARAANSWLRSSVVAYYGSGNVQTSIPKPYPLDRPATPQFPAGEVPDGNFGNASKFSSRMQRASTKEVQQFVTSQMTWDALQREWRTPPLWGVADSAPYLHDGRAKTLHEAVLWHGGEAF